MVSASKEHGAYSGVSHILFNQAHGTQDISVRGSADRTIVVFDAMPEQFKLRRSEADLVKGSHEISTFFSTVYHTERRSA